MSAWQPIADAGGWLVPADQEVMTKIDDDHGVRNVQKLTRRGSLWWMSKDMYVYYVPTHWRHLTKGDK